MEVKNRKRKTELSLDEVNFSSRSRYSSKDSALDSNSSDTSPEEEITMSVTDLMNEELKTHLDA